MKLSADRKLRVHRLTDCDWRHQLVSPCCGLFRKRGVRSVESQKKKAFMYSPEYPDKLVMSRNSRFNQWECVFWLECCVSKQIKRFKMADRESREYFPMPWMRTFRRNRFISNWVKYCPNCKIKGKFVFAFHVRDNSAQITIILGPKEAPQNAMRATFHSLERDRKIGKHLYSAFF